jgi:hypothetical protein
VTVLLLSEGKHEGLDNPEACQALQALVARVLPDWTQFVWRDIHDLPRGNPAPGQGGGHLRVALRAMQEAVRMKTLAVVCVTDADGRHERIEEFDRAQEHPHFTIPRALGLAVEAFDAWMLADHAALSRVFEATVDPLPGPETFTGGKGRPNHPKVFFRELMRRHNWGRSTADCYEAVCACADLDLMAERCPLGFAPFLKRLRQLNRELGGS